MKAKRVLFFIAVAASMLCAFACSSTPEGPPDIGGRPVDGATRYPVRLFLVEVDYYDQGHIPAYLFPGRNSAGAKFDADFDIRSFQLCMPTLHEDTRNSAVFRLFKWDGAYDTTVNSEPVVVITKRNIKNNEQVVFEIDDGVAPPGSYLWTISDATNRDPDAIVAIWSEPDTQSQYKKNAVFYYNGYETDEFFYKVIISGARPTPAAVQPAEEESSEN